MRGLKAALISVATALLLPTAGYSQNIGVVASIDPNLRGTQQGASGRTLSLGTNVFLNETIEANRTGRGQLLFNDETTLTIAPQSRVVLDTFVYDPARGNGQIGLRLTQGALRFIGGQTTKGSEAVIQTPSATIGIRGSSVLVQHRGGRTIAVFLMGDRMCYGAGGGRTCTNKQGGMVSENGFMGVIDQQSLATLLGQIDGEPPQALAPSGSGGGTQTANITQGVTPNSNPVSTSGESYLPQVMGTVGVKGSGTGNQLGGAGKKIGHSIGVGHGGTPPGKKGKGGPTPPILFE